MNLFRELSESEAETFRQWARDNYKPGDDISELWHPVVQAECHKMNDNPHGVLIPPSEQKPEPFECDQCGQMVEAGLECCPACNPPTPPFYSVAVYLQDRAYGGPEEGGWWYSCGQRIDDERDGLTARDICPRVFIHESDAIEAASLWNETRGEELNSERRSDIGSVLSEGRYRAEVHDGYPPQGYPERTPHYE